VNRKSKKTTTITTNFNKKVDSIQYSTAFRMFKSVQYQSLVKSTVFLVKFLSPCVALGAMMVIACLVITGKKGTSPI